MRKLIQTGFSCGSGTNECGTDGGQCQGQGQVPCENGQTKFTNEVVELEPVEPKPNERGAKGPELIDLGAVGGQLFGEQLENSATTAQYQDNIDLSDYLEYCTTFDENLFDDICLEDEPPQIPTPNADLLSGNKKCSEGVEIGTSTTTTTTGVSGKADGDDGLEEDLAKILDELYPPFSTEAEGEQEQGAETIVKEETETVVTVGSKVVSISIFDEDWETTDDPKLLEISSWPEFQEYLEQKLSEAKIMQAVSGAVTASEENETLVTTSNLKRGNDKDEEWHPPLKKISRSETTETQRTNANKNHSKQKQLVPPEENSQSGIGQVKTTGGSGCDAASCEGDFKKTNQENFSSSSGFSCEGSNGPVLQNDCCLLCPLPAILPQGGLVTHLLQVHSSNNQCPRCVKRFKAQNLLRMHLQSFHKLGREYKCPICAKPFYGKPTPLRHIWTHKSADEMKEAKGLGEKILGMCANVTPKWRSVILSAQFVKSNPNL